ncbi:hypothetical protein JK359_28740 [Streptomyces actinomycinicus]|uniref:Uncharacterized protein n=1 Tax=Streptomyces actinomycinicus TaxID=1695166 RepID=A0A937EMA4_9ACTN|nr:hypothetical protein [Streptomyces actinomycinicus]MBL1085908.1 hypothetical protein [Streptomyces actinomycinicus]
MTSTESRGVFALIEENFVAPRFAAPRFAAPRFAPPQDDVRSHLVVRAGDRSVQLSPQAARQALYGPRRDEALRTAVWRQAVTEARREPVHGDGSRRLLVVWLALPGTYRNLHRILRRRRVERADLEAEAVLAVLAALDTADPDSPGTGGHLIRQAVNRMWAHADRVGREVPVVDIAAFAAARNAPVPPEELEGPADGWELHLTPPPRHDGLSATIRFAESRTGREGERLGALAHCAGLPELVFRARRHEEAVRIGTLALRPAGAPR